MFNFAGYFPDSVLHEDQVHLMVYDNALLRQKSTGLKPGKIKVMNKSRLIIDNSANSCYKISTSPLLLRVQGARRRIAASACLKWAEYL
jgi:hypothetical protein